MSIIVTGFKISLNQLAKVITTEAPGTAYTLLNGAVVVGEIQAAQTVGKQTDIYIPFYGPTGIDAGVVSFAAVGLGFLAGMGVIAATAAGVTVAPGVGLLALGAGAVAAAVNPDVQLSIFDMADKLKAHFEDLVSQDKLPEIVEPVSITDFDYWSIPGSKLSENSCISKVILSNPDPLVKDIKFVMVDPLVLDLDGDGLEISPLSRGVQFDGNGDTIRTATAWVQADDGLLALDRNGNGVIDSGRELFGDETLLADGTKAAHGFAALAELDVGGAANATGGAGDGVFDAKDAQYTNVRIWRDLNQDGISQAGEMQTLQDAGIASVKLGSTKTETNYGDAQLVQSGSFTRADGSEGQAGSFILAQNNAVTTHAPIAISAEAAALMAMGTASAALPANQGSGWVRNLQEAATLTPQLLECCRQRPGRHLCRSVTSRHWCQSSPSTVSRADG